MRSSGSSSGPTISALPVARSARTTCPATVSMQEVLGREDGSDRALDGAGAEADADARGAGPGRAEPAGRRVEAVDGEPVRGRQVAGDVDHRVTRPGNG